MILLAMLLVLGAYALVKLIGGTSPSSPAVQRIAQAIAVAEGFYVSGSRPQRNHNPGDMTADLIGKKTGMDGQFVVYASDADGWNNLYMQISKWLDNSSANAGPDSTIGDISEFYTTTDQTAWSSNVASQLGVSIDTPIGDIS
jgi:hypothetical protein